MGWFKGDGNNLHGYGIDSAQNNKGVYDNGVLLSEQPLQQFQ